MNGDDSIATKNILIQYVNLQREAKDLKRRVTKVRNKLEELEKGGTVLDSVRGSRPDGTIGSIRIEGFPSAEYNRNKESLKRYIKRLTKTEADLLEKLSDVEEYISGIPDSHLRLIIRLRVIDGKTWRQVANEIGGNNTEDGVRMTFKRFYDELE